MNNAHMSSINIDIKRSNDSRLEINNYPFAPYIIWNSRVQTNIVRVHVY